jgi:hypothetical protein
LARLTTCSSPTARQSALLRQPVAGGRSLFLPLS